jgi:CheY-like chemotaxis protein
MNLDDIDLLAVTDDSNKAIGYVKDLLPDAVILDLELHQGGGNGLLFLQVLKQMNLSVYPYILITTNNTSMVTYEYARQAGGFYYGKAPVGLFRQGRRRISPDDEKRYLGRRGQTATGIIRRNRRSRSRKGS